jgi:ElaB/YqjD/DUF883 family membrane-anchored ribosome-binding protein
MESIKRHNAPSTTEMSHATEDAISKATSSAHAVVNSLAGAADQAVERAAGAAVSSVDWLTEQGENINARQKQLAADTRDYVAANPLKAVGIAVVAGFLLGRLIRR